MDWSAIIYLTTFLVLDVLTCVIVYRRGVKAYGRDFIVYIQVLVTFFLFPVVLCLLIINRVYTSFKDLQERNRKSAINREVRIKLKKILNESYNKALRRERIKKMEEANEKKA